MESNGRKRRGFMKGKLMPFHRAVKSSSTTTTTTASSVQYTSSKIMKPVVHQDYVINAQPKPKVSFILAADNGRDSLKQFENLYAGIVVDECVDSKAASYISSVQERFKLERVNSERTKCTQEMIR